MMGHSSNFIRRILCFCMIGMLLGVLVPEASAKDFVVVIDAGHGGHDPGAVGKISKEKDINLSVALKLGKLIENNCKDTKVIYTRKKDVFVKLNRRAEIANEAKADLFISIHTNSVGGGNHTAKGASTWTLGLAKSDANLQVAKRENSVILYEDDYKTRYAGFNPNSAESYIIFEFMQDQYMEKSVHLASLIQKQFKNTCQRADRGVHQAGFLVLKASAMPSVLVELGFISTPQEERYLNSANGSAELAKGIYQAFVAYKDEQLNRSGKTADVVMPKEKPQPKSSETAAAQPAPAKKTPVKTAPVKTAQTDKHAAPVFKIQIMVSDKKLPMNDRRFKGLKGVGYYREKGMYKYTYGSSTDYNKIYRMRKDIVSKFKDAFIIAFRNEEKMDVHEAIQEFKKRK